MFKSILLLSFILPLLAACSDYHPLKDGIGFTEVPIGTDTFQVTYSGDSSIAETRQLCLTRAAELALQNDATAFQIVAEQIYVSYGTHYWPGTSTTFVEGHRRDGGAILYRNYDPGYSELYTLPEAIITIHLCPPTDPNAIPAAYLLRQALQSDIKLSPGIQDRLATLPEPPPTFTLPPPPPPTTKPAYQTPVQ